MGFWPRTGMQPLSLRARPAHFVGWAVLCAAGFTLLLLPAVSALGGGWDFLPVYTGAKLAGTPDLYNPAVQERIQSALPHPTTFSLPFMRLPFVAALSWPLALLPYDTAHAVWMVLRLLAVLGFILLWPHSPRWITALACAWFVPLAGAIANGQDSPFLLLWIAVAERFRDRRPFLSGLVLALCLAKFHLFLLLPVFLWFHRRRLVPGFAAGCAALGLLSIAAGGLAWPRAYLAILKFPASNPAVAFMPNLHALQLPMPLELALSLAVFLGAALAIRRISAGPALAIALVAGMLLSYHAYFADLTLLLPALLALAPRRAPSPVLVEAVSH
jgi:Glycosyltransferase family 87